MVGYDIAEIPKNGKPLGRLFERVLFLSEYFDTENNIMLHIISQGFFNFQCANHCLSTFHFRLKSLVAVGVFTNPFENGTKVKITFEVKQPLLKVGQSRNVFFKQRILPKNK